MQADDDQKQPEEAQRMLEAAQHRLESKRRDKLRADPQTLAGAAKKLAEEMANKKAKVTEVPPEAHVADAEEAEGAGSHF